jgi:hypothetical protein
MIRLTSRLGAALFLVALATRPAWADSSASSVASDSLSTSVGSISGSFEKSSNSSSNGGDKTAAGDYKIVALAPAPARPGAVRLTLQAVADAGATGQLVLILPQAAVDQGHIATGQTVSARPRAYGVEFDRGDNGQPFFLVLADEWYSELQTRAVTL